MGNERLSNKGVKLFMMLIAVVLLAGCSRTPPVSYYQLSTRHALAAIPFPAVNSRGLDVGLGPVQLPEYLERIQIVSRSSANRLEIMANQRWAEPLATGLPRVLAEDLAFLLGNARVMRHPWPSRQPVDRQVMLEILQFEGAPERTAVLTARWTVLDGGGKVLDAEQLNTFQVDAAPGTEGLVAALSETLWRLAHEIAADLAEP